MLVSNAGVFVDPVEYGLVPHKTILRLENEVILVMHSIRISHCSMLLHVTTTARDST